MSALQPHRKRYWLTPPPDDPTELARQTCTACEVYEATPMLAAQGTHVMCTDAHDWHPGPFAPAPLLTHPAKSRRTPGIRIPAAWHAEFDCQPRRGHRPGRDPSIGPTRTEADFAAHFIQTIQTDPEVTWIFITDQLNPHQPETLVRLVAAQCDIQADLGIKGKSGHLATMVHRAAFLSDPSHRSRTRLHAPSTVLG